MAGGIEMRAVGLDRLQRAHTLEAAGYPADEAASFEGMKTRFTEAPELQLGAYSGGELIGYVCATRADGDTLTHKSMEEHVAGGESVCIHSVCVDAAYRRNGVASALLREYVGRVLPGLDPPPKRALLISKEGVLPLYTKAGFTLRGKSAVVHGADPWFECVFELE